MKDGAVALLFHLPDSTPVMLP